MVERKNKIQSDDSLPITQKCNLLDVRRSTLYYKAVDKKVDLKELEIKKLMDKLHLRHPHMCFLMYWNQNSYFLAWEKRKEWILEQIKIFKRHLVLMDLSFILTPNLGMKNLQS